MPFDRKKPGSRTPSSSPYSAYTKGGVKKPRRRKRSSKPSEGNVADGIRLQKVMAAAGIGSRRYCEELIEEGRVQIDGTAAKIGDRVDASKQVIRVDGEVLKSKSEPIYYLVNKPEGVVSTNNDPSGRPRVIDLVPINDREHLFTVGRLDLSSEGLILVTNDGELANQLTHPRYGVDKTYMALVAGKPDPSVYRQLREGVHLAEGWARCVSVYVKRELPQSTLLEIVLNEGKNREIRRILAKVGHKVLKLKRSAIGDVKLQGLKPGEFRKPTREELKTLREAMHHKKLPRPVKPKPEPVHGEIASDAHSAAVDVKSQDAKTTDAKPHNSMRRFPKRPEAVPVKGIRPDKRALEGGEGRGDERSGDGKPKKFGAKKKFEKRPFGSSPAKGSRGESVGGRRDRAEHKPVAEAPRSKKADRKPYSEKKFGGKKFAAKKSAGPQREESRGGRESHDGGGDTFEAGFPGRFFPGKKGGKPKSDYPKKKKGPPAKGYGTIIDE